MKKGRLWVACWQHRAKGQGGALPPARAVSSATSISGRRRQQILQLGFRYETARISGSSCKGRLWTGPMLCDRLGRIFGG